MAADSLSGADIAELSGADIAELTADDIAELSGAELPIKWAFVAADGTLGAQSGGITLADHTTNGVYRLNFGTDLTNYAVMATVYTDESQIEAGICGTGPPPQTNCPGTSNGANLADVLTENSAGTDIDGGFYIAAIP